MEKQILTTNKKSREFAEKLKPFKASNLTGHWENEDKYVIRTIINHFRNVTEIVKTQDL